MSAEEGLLEESLEELFEDAPCGLLSTTADGTVLKVNRTFERWTGHDREQLVGRKRFAELLAPGGRIYHETHYAPLLRMQGEARGIALELVGADGSRLPALVDSVVAGDAGSQTVRIAVFDAGDRRRYEEELLRARERETEIARRLQQSMLTGELPSGPTFEVGSGYRPADQGMDVGGDWYDAFSAGEERVVLVVGDVVGRGIDAAATMGQLRSATRALASTGLGPADLLGALDRYSDLHGVGGMTTMVLAEIRLGERELRLASAGHLPPLLAPPGEDPQLVWEGRSTPLGVRSPARPERAETSLPLDPGSLFVLYTDGLVERRGEAIDDGIYRLVAELRPRRDEAPGALSEALLHALGEGENRDDACLLALSTRA